MKLLVAAALLSLTATPAFAQDTAPPAAPAAATKLTIDSPIEALLADPGAKGVLEANLPGISTRDDLDSFKSYSLPQVAPYSNGLVTAEALKKIAEGLAALP